MNTRSIICRLAFLFILAASCNKKLDLAPGNTVVEKDVFKTEAGSEQALSEVYYNFLKAITNYFSYMYGDFTTPLLEKSTYYNVYDLGEATPTDFYVVSTWSNYFKTINAANNVIAKIPEYAKYDVQKQKQFIAEAKFIRAYCYLNLLCLYGDGALAGKGDGLGLPLQLTPFEGYNTGEIIPRNTNNEVFDQIIADLSVAAVDLPERFSDELKTRSRATKGAALALLARTYLYKHDYEQASDAAQKVLQLSPSVYSITGNLLNLFPPNADGSLQSFTAEIVFGLPVSQMVSSSTRLDNSIGSTYYYKRSYWVSADFTNEFEVGDLRRTLLIWKGDSVYNPNMFNEKTTFKFNNRYGRDNVSMIRLAEVMLTRAECLARSSGINTESIQLLNQIRRRSVPMATDFDEASFANGQALIDTILKQRKFELAFEGLHRYDLIRTGQPLHEPDLPANRKVLPVPQVEVDISHGLIKQNSGY